MKQQDNTDLMFTQNYKTDTVYTGDFSHGKYISIASDSPIEPVVEEDVIIALENTRTKIVATFITEKNTIVGLKLVKYNVANGELQPDPQIFNLPLDQLITLKSFLEFLERSDLKSLASKQITFGESLTYDKDLMRKIYTLAKLSNGKELLKDIVGQLMDSTEDISTKELLKFGLTQNRIKKRYQELDDFQKIIDDPNILEVSGVQAALKKIPWIFGPEYTSYDFRPAGDVGLPDGRLKRVDGLSDILEVKLPNEELLRTEKGRHYISLKCSEAIGQLTSYLEYYHSAYTMNKDDNTGGERLDDDYGRYYKPKGILLIGRRSKKDLNNTTSSTADNEPKFMRRLLSYYHWIEILTYDDLLERARNGLTNLAK